MTHETDVFQNLKDEIEQIINSSGDDRLKLQTICDLLYDGIEHYDWVGFYLVDDKNQELILGPFTGKETEHARIPFGRGICGQAVQTGETMVIRDVAAETNYLSCSSDVKSEIVVPIFRSGKIVAELDIDSNFLSPFTPDDVDLLEYICGSIPGLIDDDLTALPARTARIRDDLK